MTVLARHSGLDIFKTAPGPDRDRAPNYTTGELRSLLTRGLAYQLGNGRIAAITCPADLQYWITQCKGSYGRGTPEDSDGLRAFVTRRAAALGLRAEVGSWSVPQTTADTGAKAAAVRAAADSHIPAATAALKAGLRKLELNVREDDGTTLFGRLYAEAQRYERKAGQVSDPVTAAGYRQLAKQKYAEAGIVR